MLSKLKFIANTHKYHLDKSDCWCVACYKHEYGKQVVVGKPMQTPWKSMNRLMEEGYVGIYFIK